MHYFSNTFLIQNSTLYQQNPVAFSGMILQFYPFLHNTEFYLQHVLQFNYNIHVYTWAG